MVASNDLAEAMIVIEDSGPQLRWAIDFPVHFLESFL